MYSNKYLKKRISQKNIKKIIQKLFHYIHHFIQIYLKKASIVICPRSFIRHVTSLLSIPLVNLWRSENYFKWAPHGEKAKIIYHNEVCTSCQQDICPQGKNRMYRSN